MKFKIAADSAVGSYLALSKAFKVVLSACSFIECLKKEYIIIMMKIKTN